MILTWVISCVLRIPDAQEEEIVRRALQELADEKIEVRDKAAAALKNLPYRWVEKLRVRQASEKDPELQKRLEEVVRHLSGTEGERLFREGRLQPALLKFAEAGGAEDPRAEVDRRTKAAREFLSKCFASSSAKEILYPPEELQELRDKHGKWAVLPLIEFLGTSDSFGAYVFIKRGLDFDVIPVLCAALRESDGRSTNPICNMLAGLGRSPLSTQTLRSVMEDKGRNESSRKAAEAALRELGELRDDK